MKYGIRTEVGLNFSNAVEKVKQGLSKEGFGILTQVDVRATLKKKLNVDYEDYVILGACNPPFAYDALRAEKEVGLLLPCNVIIYVQGGKTFVSMIDPVGMMSVVNNSKLKGIAKEVKEKLNRVLENLK